MMGAAHVLDQLRAVRAAVRRRREAARSRRLEAILARPGPPDTAAVEAAFPALQAAYRGAPAYGYDPFSLWKRAADRSARLIALLGGTADPLATLEVGCGDAMTSRLLGWYGYRPTGTDLDDWRDPRAADVPLVRGPLEGGLPLGADGFDLVFSYNTFEHLDDPALCLREVVRVTRPGGLVHLDFGPLYASPWGLHAYRTLTMPYPQFLFSDRFVAAKLAELGIVDLGGTRQALQPLNRWTPGRFEALWRASGCEVVDERASALPAHLDLVERFPAAFAGRGLTVRDLATSHLTVTLRKPGGRG